MISLAGLALWYFHRRDTRKLRRLALPDRATKDRRRALSWHGAVGVWIVVALLGLSVTGITWSRYGGESVNLIQEKLNTTAPSVDTVLAQSAGPDTAGGGHQHGAAEANSGDGRLHGADWPFLAKLTNWAIDAHMGVLFGIPNQILLALTAIGLITIVLRGYRMWWQRRPTRGSGWAAGRAPLRGVLRTLPPPALAALAVVTVAVGWFLPLVGLSLLAFLAADLVIGTVKQRLRSS